MVRGKITLGQFFDAPSQDVGFRNMIRTYVPRSNLLTSVDPRAVEETLRQILELTEVEECKS